MAAACQACQVPVLIVLPRNERDCFAIRPGRKHMSNAQSRHLRGSEKELIADLLRPFLGTCLDKASKFAFERWVHRGAWQQEGDGTAQMEAVGCALLKSPPIPLDSFVAMQSKHFWVLWHA